MARPDQEKCRLCSKLTAPAAKQLHGPDGDRCWDEAYCHKRRSIIVIVGSTTTCALRGDISNKSSHWLKLQIITESLYWKFQFQLLQQQSFIGIVRLKIRLYMLLVLSYG
jgi:hypothetical protein